jgi:hypothetical protein
MSKKKLFISQPFSGLTREEVMKKRQIAIDELRNIFSINASLYEFGSDDYQVINNYDHPTIPEDAGRLEHLGESIKQMSSADLVYFSGDWNKARGCMIERYICIIYKIPYIVSPNTEDSDEELINERLGIMHEILPSLEGLNPVKFAKKKRSK